MFSTLVTGPITPVFTAAEAKDQARIDGSAEDSLVAEMVARATAYFDAKDGITGEALISQTWKLTLSDAEVSNAIALPIGPVQSVTSVQYYADGTLTTFGAVNYRLVNGVLSLVEGAAWPALDARDDAFQITYVAGHGDTSGDISPTTRHAIALLAADFYEVRTSTNGEASKPTDSFQSLVSASRSARGLF